MFSFQGLRRVLRNAITWTIGYNLYKTWDKTAILVMDDPGNAQNAWLKHWHYTTLSEETITEHLIIPLKKSDAVLNINFVPGFVNHPKENSSHPGHNNLLILSDLPRVIYRAKGGTTKVSEREFS